MRIKTPSSSLISQTAEAHITQESVTIGMRTTACKQHHGSASCPKVCPFYQVTIERGSTGQTFDGECFQFPSQLCE